MTGRVQLLEREDPLAALGAAHASAARGEGRVAILTGEAGIGKTTLVRAFLGTLTVETKVLQGTCDDLSVARPLGAFTDLIGSVPAALERAIVEGAPPQELHPLLHAELDARSRTTVLVVEDVHWADDATLDALTFLARRIRSLRALLVLTLRPGEAPADHPLHAALGDIPAESAVHVALEPLSRAGVQELAGEAAGAAVYEVTHGNPFFVTELLADDEGADVPASVAHAVLGRAARLEPDARRLVDLVSLVPRRISTALLDRAFPEWADAAAEPERRRLLEVRPRFVAFRHELVRAAIRGGIPAATRRKLHREVLAALLETHADPADIVHQAEAAGADDVVGEYVRVAARRAAASHSNREAYAHYHRTLDFLERYPRDEQARVLEELASAAHLVGRFEDSLVATREAAAIWRELQDDFAVGRCTTMLSRLYWFVGDGVESRAKVAEAIGILEPFGPTHELATAYGLRSRSAMLAADAPAARAWAMREIEVADELDDPAARIHALVTLATVEVEADPSPEPALAAHTAALAAGEWYEAVIVLANVALSLLEWGRTDAASEYVARALVEAEEHDLRHLVSHIKATLALVQLRIGEWAEAERLATEQVRRNASVAGLLAQTVLTELAVRRGDTHAEQRLAELDARAARAADAEWVVPVVDLFNELSLTADRPPPTERLRVLRNATEVHGQLAVRIAAAAAVGGLGFTDVGDVPSPFRFVAAGDWRAAADAFGESAWPYERALMLSLLDHAPALEEALAIARRLGAVPLEDRAARRLRELGHGVPRGPYGTARANPAHLTARQLEVLALVVGGRTNQEIADELVVSLRTAEHHVAAVLRKLGARSRRDAAQRADELGIAYSER